MKKIRWIILSVILVLTLALLLPACAQQSAAPSTASSSGSPQYGGVLKIIYAGSLTNIGLMGAPDDMAGLTAQFGKVARPAMEPILTYDTSERFSPWLTEVPDIAPDGKNLTLRVRQGIKFHDGTPLNAEAVKYNYDLRKNSKQVTVNNPVRNLSSIDVVDEYTVKFNFSRFDYQLLLSFGTTTLYSPTALKIQSTSQTQAKDHMIGTGPFKFVDYVREQSVKYAKWDGYRQAGRPYPDGIEMNQIADSMTALMSFKKGDANLITGITPSDSRELEVAGYKIITGNNVPSISYLIPDGANKDSPFANIKMRQAVDYAIDKKTLAKSLGKGYYQPVSQFAPDNGPYYDASLTSREYNSAKAKQLLSEAGYPNGLKTSLISTTTVDRDALVAIQTYLKEAGIDATLDLADATRFKELQTKGWKNGILFPSSPSNANLNSFAYGHFPSTNNVSMYRGEWQQTLDQALAEVNYDKRNGLVKKMVKLQFDDAMTIPMWTSSDISAVDKKVHDINWGVGGHPIMWTPWDVWLSK